ncbi:hypothetical protein HBZS_114200 [Helicobacter bizzozeronii CCUG 35545]|nr:hypothetical protein HBZS_114200 [Helicobacter bizzozeronii CCUG 35545]
MVIISKLALKIPSKLEKYTITTIKSKNKCPIFVKVSFRIVLISAIYGQFEIYTGTS